MKKEILSIILAVGFSLTALIVSNSYLKIVLFIVAWLFVGTKITISAIKTIKNRAFLDENFLMSIASIGAFCIGEQIEAVAVMLFYRVGEIFEDYSVNKSRKSIEEAMDIMPDYANLKTDYCSKRVDPKDIKVGDIILIKPGEKVPLDGVIIKGRSSLNTSALTGESIPKELKIGDEIISGYVNINGLLQVRVSALFENSTVAQILELVEDASSKKSHQEKFITKFARVYTPIVVIAALFLALIPPLFFGDFKEWFYRALIFLVVSCPCALVISVPLSFFGGIAGASKRGVLVKGGNYLDALWRIKTVIFDKTGTLTKGEFNISKIVANSGFNQDEILKFSAYAQAHSTHPIGISLIKHYKEHLGEKIDETLISKLEEIPGKGIKATINGSEILIGNHELLSNFELPTLYETSSFLAINGRYAGYITFKDQERKEAKKVIQTLKDAGIKTFMFTGDKAKTANKIAQNLGIDEIYAELLPADKVKNLEILMSQKPTKSTLAYVGGGINDAPVLARADIGISMFGSNAAIEAGDIVLLDNNLEKLITAIKISKKTVAIAYQNIIFSIGIKFIVLILAIFGLASMWAAIFADVGVTCLAILNSLRVFRYATKAH
ncbi:MAG: cadmium-translocating P-type ATPase [Campylobacter sp.]|nr:cadmium-translocating P-type ATPase [Campylobacter sp.]